MKTCRECGLEKPIEDFQKDKRLADGHTRLCKECASDYANQWHKDNREHHNNKMKAWWRVRKHERPEIHLWELAKRRAKEDSIPFSISPADIVVPDYCPVFNTKLEFVDNAYSPNAPSLDRLISEIGYVPGNVSVISHKANTMKSNGTLEELKSLVAWLEKQQKD